MGSIAVLLPEIILVTAALWYEEHRAATPKPA